MVFGRQAQNNRRMNTRVIAVILTTALSFSALPVLANEGSDGVPVTSLDSEYPTRNVVRLNVPYTVVDGFRVYDFNRATVKPEHHSTAFLGIAQAADCGTTALGLALGVAVEANPIALLLGGKSLPLCLLRMAASNAYARRNPTFARSATASESAAVISNAAILLR